MVSTWLPTLLGFTMLFPLTFSTLFLFVWVYLGGKLERMRVSHHCRVTLILLVYLTIVPLVLLVTLKMEGWILLIAAVETAVFLLSVRLDVVLAEEGRVAVPLAQLLSGNNSSMEIIAVKAGVLPVVMFLMRLGRTRTSLP